MNKLYILLLLTISSLPVFAWDPSIIVGEWESYSHDHGHQYKHFLINKDFTGTYTLIIEHNRKIAAPFNKKNFTFHDGYVILKLNKSYTFVLSAFGLKMPDNTKRLLGQQLMYVKEKNEKILINSASISMSPVKDTNIVNFFNKVSKAIE